MTEYVIRGDGAFVRTVEESEVQINDSIIEALATGVQRKVERLMEVGGNYGGVGFTSQQSGHSAWSVRVRKLPLRAPCATENGLTVPVFDNLEAPVMDLLWEAPPSMLLLLVLHLKEDLGHYKCWQQNLVALDGAGRQYRLPLSNLYQDCKLCNGLGGGATGNCRDALKAVSEALTQFDKSQWNNHLYNEATAVERKNTKLLFRFKPTATGFEQAPSEGDWTTLATKIANEALSKVLIPVAL